MKPLSTLYLTLRELMAGTAASIAATTASTAVNSQTPFCNSALKPLDASYVTSVSFEVNGSTRKLDLDTGTTLLDALREHLHLTGSKKGCDQGQCGACTVLINGWRVTSRLTLAIMHEGDTVTTVEGLGTPGNLHPMQAAFIEHDGYQCGYCTPGQICSAVAVLDQIKAGIPSHATADLTAATYGSRAPRAHERQHLPLRCLFQHR